VCAGDASFERKKFTYSRTLPDENWISDPVAYDAAMFAATLLLDCAAPEPTENLDSDKDQRRFFSYDLVKQLVPRITIR